MTTAKNLPSDLSPEIWERALANSCTPYLRYKSLDAIEDAPGLEDQLTLYRQRIWDFFLLDIRYSFLPDFR